MFKMIKKVLSNYKLINSLCDKYNCNDIDELNTYISQTDKKCNIAYDQLRKQNELILKIQTEINTFVDSHFQITEGVNNIAIGATDQAENIQVISKSFNELASFVDKTTVEYDNLLQDFEGMAVNVLSGTNVVNELDSKIYDSINATSVVNKNINSLISSIKEVEQFTKSIKDISETIKLLSFNAQIEAARAGDAGRGFAVIANEVNNLAKKTIDTTKDINNTVINIGTKIDSVLEPIKISDNAIKEVITKLEQTKNVFNNIENSAENATIKVNNLQDNIENVSSCKDEIMPNIENIAAITEEYSASTEEINATCESLNLNGKKIMEVFNDYNIVNINII